MLETIANEIIAKGILPKAACCLREMKGGTQSVVGVIGTPEMPDQWMVKSNSREIIAAETRFLQVYKGNPLLPAIHYIDPDDRYFIYSYIPGSTSYKYGNKMKFMEELISGLISKYVPPASPEEYEWVEAPERVMDEIHYSRGVIGDRLEEDDHALAESVHLRRDERLTRERLVVLHGDLGVHNLLFDDERLSGVIDPLPGVGRPLYDALYAFCSSPDDLRFEMLREIAARLDSSTKPQELAEDMLLALYFRISTCLRHHPQDFDAYLEAWRDWAERVRSV